MYEEVLSFKNEELSAIHSKKADIIRKYEEQEKIIQETRNNIIEESQKQLNKHYNKNKLIIQESTP